MLHFVDPNVESIKPSSFNGMDMCAKLDGETEFSQLQYVVDKYLSKEEQDKLTFEEKIQKYDVKSHSDRRFRLSREEVKNLYTYDVKSRMSSGDGFQILTLMIHEKINGTPTEGGTNFRTHLEAPSTVDLCPYKDFFNGVYLICCKIRQERTQVTVKLMYVNFTMPFMMGSKSVDRVIWSEKINTSVNGDQITKQK